MTALSQQRRASIYELLPLLVDAEGMASLLKQQCLSPCNCGQLFATRESSTAQTMDVFASKLRYANSDAVTEKIEDRIVKMP